MANGGGFLSAENQSFPRQIVDRYTARLLQVARRRLPERLRGRVDPEDIVQSVYRSFFWRLKENQFSFDDSFDIWRLLAVMTYHKVQNAVKHHGRARRDVRREQRSISAGGLEPAGNERAPGPEDVAIFFECLENLMQNLPEKYRKIIALRLEGNTIAEVAAQVGYSQRTVLRVLANVQESAIQQMEPLP